MEELDLLKKDWKKNENKFPTVSEQEIYAMLHKNSTSVVKWIFVISILEFAFFLALTLLTSTKEIDGYISKTMMTILTAVDYAIMVYFFFLFYINYKKITSTDKIKNLMSSIIKTRKTVSAYIFAKITFIIIMLTYMFLVLFYNEPEMIHTRLIAEEKGKSYILYIVTFIVVLFSLAIVATAFWYIYKLVYGKLLKRLKKNYDELKKIDL